MLTIRVFKDKADKWRWNLRAKNGKKIATSGESFVHKGNAKRAAEKMLDLLGVECAFKVES